MKQSPTQQAIVIDCMCNTNAELLLSFKNIFVTPFKRRRKKYEKYESDIKQMLDGSCQSCLSMQVLMCYNYPFWQLIFRILDPT